MRELNSIEYDNDKEGDEVVIELRQLHVEDVKKEAEEILAAMNRDSTGDDEEED